jgi:ribosomal protein S18 acetylase RimI-like enzyme
MSVRNQELLRSVVIWISVVICILSFAYTLYLRAVAHSAVPLWNKIAMTYGGVFCVFLFFDNIGRQSAKWRQERRTAPVRPRPVVSATPGQRVATPSAPVLAADHIRLERVRRDQSEPFRAMVRTCCEEVLALDGKRPQWDGHMDVVGVPVQEWLTSETCHPFYIVYQDRRIGCAVLKTGCPAAELALIYVESALRRRRGGAAAMRKLVEFLKMLGTCDSLTAELSVSNMRGQRFLYACGFRPVDTGEAAGTVRMELDLAEGARP